MRRLKARFQKQRGSQCLAQNGALRDSLKMIFPRITVEPGKCSGKPCIRGMRFPVSRLLGLLAAGESREAILADFPYIESADIDEALRYAAFLAEDETVELVP